MLLEVIRTQTDIAKLGLDLGGVMSLVAERAQSLTGANGAAIELAEGDEMIYRATSGVAGGQLGLRLKRDGSLSGLCVRQGQILCCDDSETDHRVDREACRRVGLRSMIVVPLKHGDETVGVLKVMAFKPSAFAEDDRRTLALMAELIAAAMFHAGKYGTNELYVQATHDAMTGLSNRAHFFDRLTQALGLAKRDGTKLGVLNIDMDGLKRINDAFGHRAGDAAIIEFAARLKSSIRQTDSVARLGGDEFAVLMPSITGRDAARAQIARVHETIKQPFRFGSIPLKLEASIGVAFFPDDGSDGALLVDAADRDMYAIKHARKSSRLKAV